MTTRQEQLKNRIMRRVYVIAAIRMLLHPTLLKALIGAVLFWRSTEYVSYGNVFANSPSLLDVSRNVHFYGSAFKHAEGATLVLLLGIGAMLAWVAFDMVQKRSHAWF